MIPADAELTARPEEIPAWDEIARRPQAGARAPDGGLRRASWSTPTTTSAGCSTRSRSSASSTTRSSTASSATTARRPRATCTARFNELINLNGADALQTTEFMASRIDEFGTPAGVQPLRGRLGPRDGHAVPVDEAGRLALGRHAQRHDRPLARRDRGKGRGPPPVPPRDRRRADGARGGGHPRPPFVNGIQQAPLEGVSMAYSFEDAERRRRGTRRSTSRCS